MSITPKQAKKLSHLVSEVARTVDLATHFGTPTDMEQRDKARKALDDYVSILTKALKIENDPEVAKKAGVAKKAKKPKPIEYRVEYKISDNWCLYEIRGSKAGAHASAQYVREHYSLSGVKAVRVVKVYAAPTPNSAS